MCALIKSTIFADVRGSIAGTTFARNRSGAYARTRTIPVNPNSSRQQSVRGLMSVVSQQWSLLTSNHRNAWDNYAAQTPVINRLGDTIYLSGFNMFLRTNMLYQEANPNDAIDEAPITPGVAEKLNIIAAQISSSASTAPGVPNQVLIESATGRESGNTDLNFIYISNPVSAGTAFYKAPWNFCGFINGDDDPFAAISPFPITVGQHFFIRYKQMKANGKVSAESIFGPVTAITVTT